MGIHRSGTMKSVVVAGTVVIVASAALAYGTTVCSKGWRFGQASCSPKNSTNDTRKKCYFCCAAGLANTINSINDTEDCNKFCNQVRTY